MNNYKTLNVFMGTEKVGTLAVMANHLVAFAYEAEWIDSGFSISPFSLPLQSGVLVPKDYDPFEGLFGVFSDSLPDGWGRLLVDRLLARQKIDPAQVNSLTRLAIVGTTGMGALTYQPESPIETGMSDLSLDQLAMECKKMFQTEQSEDLDTLFQMGGSSGGARPKIFYRIDGEDWIVKFPSSMDRPDIGRQEYDHSKNFSFLCRQGSWVLAPAYDLTYSNSIGGEHATTVDGNGVNPGMTELLAVADQAKLDRKKAKETAEEIRETVRELLNEYLTI